MYKTKNLLNIIYEVNKLSFIILQKITKLGINNFKHRNFCDKLNFFGIDTT